MSADVRVTLPGGHVTERRYVLDVVLSDWLGLVYEAVEGTGDSTIMEVAGSAAKLQLADAFFPAAAAHWLDAASLPAAAPPVWDMRRDLPEARLVSPSLPVIYATGNGGIPYFSSSNDCISLQLDIFGTIFFLLSRYEERVSPSRDAHGRFPSSSSHAAKVGYLLRPLANEYAEVLWACMTRLWPSLQRRQRQYRLALSHDVDRPFATTGKSWPEVALATAIDLVRYRRPGVAMRRVASRLQPAARRWPGDPYNTFGFIMQTSERSGLSSTFFFMAGCTNTRFDDNYPLASPEIADLMRRMKERGHGLGLHPSYETWLKPEQIRSELDHLQSAAGAAGIRQGRWTGRQHYLRLTAPETWRHYEAAGLQGDASLGYADHIGFRSGSCWEYPLFDIDQRRKLEVREEPLLAMEVSLLNLGYMGIRPDDVPGALAPLVDACRRLNGTFSLLWHNTSLLTDRERRLYADCVRMAA